MSNQVHTPNVKLPAFDAMIAASKAGKRLAEAATTVEAKIALMQTHWRPSPTTRQ